MNAGSWRRSSDSAAQPATEAASRSAAAALRPSLGARHSRRVLRVLLIGGFGFLGTIARYAVQGVVQRVSGSTFPYGTLAVNVLGSFVVGLIATLALERAAMSPLWRSAILIGFCGGFTTFSALAYETFELARTGDPLRAGLNLVASAALGLAAVWIGYATAVKL